MQRMMHSLFFIVCFGAPAYAQQTTSSLLFADISSNQAGSTAIEVGGAPAGKSLSSESEAATVESGHNDNRYTQPACNGPYSQLGVRMSCSDASPNLWCGYPAERAALAAKVMKHVDMQCDCCEVGGCSKVKSATCSSKINRYKEPFSTLYSVPCVQCNTGKSKIGHRLHDAMPATYCNSCVPNSAPGYPSQYETNGYGNIPSPSASMVAPPDNPLASRPFIQPKPFNLTR
jgi:hypothetical protein